MAVPKNVPNPDIFLRISKISQGLLNLATQKCGDQTSRTGITLDFVRKAESQALLHNLYINKISRWITKWRRGTFSVHMSAEGLLLPARVPREWECVESQGRVPRAAAARNFIQMSLL